MFSGSFKDQFSGGLSSLRRRFSSTDIPGDVEDEETAKQRPFPSGPSPSSSTTSTTSHTSQFNKANSISSNPPPPPPHTMTSGGGGGAPGSTPSTGGFSSVTNVASTFMSGLSQKTRGPSPSAPTSPSRTLSFSSAVPGFTRSLFSSKYEKCKNLLVIDEASTDWSKYFRGKKLHGEWEVRVEQAEFSEISICSSGCEEGATVDIFPQRTGGKLLKGFKPDFVLVRQRVRNGAVDHRNVLIGLQYAGIPSVNTLYSIYNFLDKPWVYAQLLNVQRKLGKNKFPLLDQIYYYNIKGPMAITKLPAVAKIGHAYFGVGKIKIEEQSNMSDVSTMLALTGNYCTTEPFVDAKYDIHVQKIGTVYKAFMRKSISGNWKANIGSSMLEQISMNERFKLWVDECSRLFGGLDIVAVQAVQGKDGKEYIIEIDDCCVQLLGESQEEDRRQITSLVLHRMQQLCVPPPSTAASTSSTNAPHHPPQPHPSSQPRRSLQHNRTTSAGGGPHHSGVGNAVGPPLPTTGVNQTQTRPGGGGNPHGAPPGPSQSHGKGHVQNAVPLPSRPGSKMADGGPGAAGVGVTGGGGAAPVGANPGVEGEDTMKNLRKTFAGIFGDMVQ